MLLKIISSFKLTKHFCMPIGFLCFFFFQFYMLNVTYLYFSNHIIFSNKIIVKKVEILQVTIKTDLFFFVLFLRKKSNQIRSKPNCPILKSCSAMSITCRWDPKLRKFQTNQTVPPPKSNHSTQT